MIDRNIFLENLKLTQNYCESHKMVDKKNICSILRNINPVINGNKVFDFKNINDDQFGKLQLTNWKIDPLYKKDIINEIYIIQLNYKKLNVIKKQSISDGKILITRYKDTLFEGFCELVSNGFIDEYDLPPIDTWFYLDDTADLYSWVPNEFIPNVDKAINSSSTDIYSWIENIN